VKETLRTSIRAMLIPTPATGLRGMPWVNFDHLNTSLLRLVGQEGVELGEAPTMQAALGIVLLALADLATLTNVLEVF